MAVIRLSCACKRTDWILWISMLLMRPQDDFQTCSSGKNSIFFNKTLRSLLLGLWQQKKQIILTGSQEAFSRVSCDRSGCFHRTIRTISSQFKAKTWCFPDRHQVGFVPKPNQSMSMRLFWRLGCHGLHRSPLESDAASPHQSMEVIAR